MTREAREVVAKSIYETHVFEEPDFGWEHMDQTAFFQRADDIIKELGIHGFCIEEKIE